jgi:hypothetical protein
MRKAIFTAMVALLALWMINCNTSDSGGGDGVGPCSPLVNPAAPVNVENDVVRAWATSESCGTDGCTYVYRCGHYGAESYTQVTIQTDFDGNVLAAQTNDAAAVCDQACWTATW